MSRNGRIGLLVGTVVVLVLVFVLLSPGADDESSTATTPTVPAPVTTPESPAGDSTQTTTAPPPPPPSVTFNRIRVQGSKPAGGVKSITVKKGERARIQVSSQDTSDEIHLHDYDITRDLKAGGSVRFSFVANAEGIFEIELEGAGVEIGKLVVEP